MAVGVRGFESKFTNIDDRDVSKLVTDHSSYFRVSGSHSQFSLDTVVRQSSAPCRERVFESSGSDATVRFHG